MMQRHQVGKIRKAFTLIEMLVVLLIIGILAAILFPVLKSAREGGYQASCATNLHQIYLAVELYKNDEGGYPPSLAPLLPNTVDLADGSLNVNGKGYFKGGKDALICSDDDTDSTTPRSSYGDLNSTGGASGDFGRYIWNYWGYRTIGEAKKPDSNTPVTGCKADDVSECLSTSYNSDPTSVDNLATPTYSAYSAVFVADAKHRYLVNPADATSPIDYTKLPRLANRFAPPTTIITHCVYHRLPTSNIVGNYDLYDATNADGQGAKDIILRLDGTAKVLDASSANFVTGDAWTLQNF